MVKVALLVPLRARPAWGRELEADPRSGVSIVQDESAKFASLERMDTLSARSPTADPIHR